MARFAGVRAKGSGIEVVFQVNGRRHWRYIDKAPTDAALQDAARLRKKWIEAARLGGVDAATPLTFEEACRAFLTSLDGKRKPATIMAYGKRLTAHWSELAHRDVREITRKDVRRIDGERKWASQKTRRDSISALSCVLQWAVAEGYASENVTRNWEKITHQRPDVEIFTPAELDAILGNLRGTPAALYGLMAETGCRTSELRALRWEDVEDGAIRISGTLWEGKKVSTKTATVRRVLLTAKAKRLLKEHTASRFAGGYVFMTSRGNPYDLKDLTAAFSRACEAAGVRYRRPYTLRHTYASRALSAGVEPSWLAAQLGDRLETVLRHYARWIGGERDERELRKLERL